MDQTIEYKNSGVEWLGSIPSHWGIEKLKYVADFTERGDAPTYTDEGTIVVNQSCLSTYKLNLQKAKFHQSKANPRTFRGWLKKGDFLIASTGMGVLGKCAIYDSNEPAFADSHITIVRDSKNRLDNKYLFYLLSVQYEMINACLAEGATKQTELQRDEFQSLLIPQPPQSELIRIIKFLDQKTAEIDEAIAKKQRLIELLKEQKAILINQAVTKGLNPNAPMRDSGVEWIGEVPEHWEVIRLKFLIRKMDQGWSPQCFNYIADENQWGVLKVGCVNRYIFNPNENKVLPSELKSREDLQAKHDDILISRANSLELVGSAAHLDKPRSKLIICDKLYRVTVNQSNVIPQYFVLLLQSVRAREQVEIGANGASPSMQNIGQNVIKDLWAALPPKEEQLTILRILEERESVIDKTVENTQKEIEALNEYRAILIANAVTGKIKL